MIKAKRLAKQFKDFQAVKDVTFEAYPGQVFGLLGPNGAGKTTTMRMLSTMLTPTSGTAWVDGHDIQDDKNIVRSRLGILVENAGLYARSTAREHLRFVGGLHGMGGPKLERQIDYLIELLDMQDFADRRAQGFSRGMTRKVVLGMALVHNPPNVILDEPTQGLDVVSTRTVRGIIRRFKEEGRCVILSTHHMDEVERLCDRVAVIHRGKILEEGTPQTLVEKYHVDRLETAFVTMVGSEETTTSDLKRSAQDKRKHTSL